MKIIYCTRGRSISGGSAYLNNIIHVLAEKDEVSKILVIAPDTNPEIVSEKVEFRILPVPGKYFITKEPYFALACGNVLKQVLKREQYDVIDLQASTIFESKDTPIVSTFHFLHSGMLSVKMSSLGNLRIKDYLQYALAKFYHVLYSYFDYYRLRKSSINVFVSNASRKAVSESNPSYAGKNMHIPNCIDTSLFQFLNRKSLLKEKYRIPVKNKAVLFVGRLDYTKGINCAIKALEKLENITFITVGSGPYESELRKIPYAVNYKNIPHTQMIELYNLSDLLVFPSTYENCPTAVLEAMACQLPVIASPAGDIPLIIKSPWNGIICDTGNPEVLGREIKAVLDDNNAADTIGRNARETIVGNYSREIVAGKIWSLYNNLLKNREKKNAAE